MTLYFPSSDYQLRTRPKTQQISAKRFIPNHKHQQRNPSQTARISFYPCIYCLIFQYSHPKRSNDPHLSNLYAIKSLDGWETSFLLWGNDELLWSVKRPDETRRAWPVAIKRSLSWCLMTLTVSPPEPFCQIWYLLE